MGSGYVRLMVLRNDGTPYRIWEPTDVRIDVLRRLRESPDMPMDRGVVAACLCALRPDQQRTLRLQAALALGDFVTTDAALQALGCLAAEPAEAIELRYNAFTALQRAGPTEACLAQLRALEADDVLGPSVQSLLASWGRA